MIIDLNLSDDVIDAIASAVVRKIDFKSKEAPNTQSARDPLTVPDAAALLRVRPISVYRLIKRGEIKYMKRSRRIYFNREDILEYLEAGRIKTKDEIESEVQSFLNNKKRPRK